MNNFNLKTWFLIITAILALTLSAHGEEKRFQVTKGGKLELKLNIGDVHIVTWDRNEVLVKYDKNSDDEGEGQLEISQNGNIIHIEAGGWGDNLESVTLPNEFNAEVKTNAGNIDLKGNLVGKLQGISNGGDVNIENINGSLDISTAGGNIKLGFARGNVNVKTNGGDMKCGDIDGDIVIKIGGGNITLGKISKSLKMKTGGGNIKVTETGGDAQIITGGGNVSINNSNGKVDISTGGGDIRINSSKGEVKAKTSAGRIFMGNVMNKVNIYTGAGDAELTFNSGYKGNSDIKTSSGEINVIVPEVVKATITAKTNSWGFNDEEDNKLDNIKSDYKPFKIDKSNEDGEVTAVYQVSGGGNNINLTSVNGDISIKKNK